MVIKSGIRCPGKERGAAFFVIVLAFALLVATELPAKETLRVYAGRNWTSAKLQNAGNDQLERGDLEGARRSFDAAIKLDPTMWPAYYNRARLFMKQHKWELALQDATMALRGNTSVIQSALLRARAYRYLGNYQASLHDLDHIITLRPEGTYPLALNARAWLRATAPNASFRNGKLAVEDATLACGATLYRKAAFLDTLAAAYAESGDFDSAVRQEERALAAENSSRDQSAEIKRKLEQHLALFKQHRPVREIREIDE
jgi:tetratricopeptide (TPR) repeat protein